MSAANWGVMVSPMMPRTPEMLIMSDIRSVLWLGILEPGILAQLGFFVLRFRAWGWRGSSSRFVGGKSVEMGR
jgi:hypothetical protein